MNSRILQSVAMSAEAELKELGAESISHILTFKRYVVDVTATKLTEDEEDDTENA